MDSEGTCRMCGRPIPLGQKATITEPSPFRHPRLGMLGETVTWFFCHRNDEDPTCYERASWGEPRPSTDELLTKMESV